MWWKWNSWLFIGRTKKGVHYTQIITDFITELQRAGDRNEYHHIQKAEIQDDNSVLEKDIHFTESLLNDPTNIAVITTQFLSAAFIDSSRYSTTSAESDCSKTVKRKRQKVRNGEWVTDALRAYLSKEVKRMEKTGFLVDIGRPKTVSWKKLFNKILYYSRIHKFSTSSCIQPFSLRKWVI